MNPESKLQAGILAGLFVLLSLAGTANAGPLEGQTPGTTLCVTPVGLVIDSIGAEGDCQANVGDEIDGAVAAADGQLDPVCATPGLNDCAPPSEASLTDCFDGTNPTPTNGDCALAPLDAVISIVLDIVGLLDNMPAECTGFPPSGANITTCSTYFEDNLPALPDVQLPPCADLAAIPADLCRALNETVAGQNPTPLLDFLLADVPEPSTLLYTINQEAGLVTVDTDANATVVHVSTINVTGTVIADDYPGDLTMSGHYLLDGVLQPLLVTYDSETGAFNTTVARVNDGLAHAYNFTFNASTAAPLPANLLDDDTLSIYVGPEIEPGFDVVVRILNVTPTVSWLQAASGLLTVAETATNNSVRVSVFDPNGAIDLGSTPEVELRVPSGYEVSDPLARGVLETRGHNATTEYHNYTMGFGSRVKDGSYLLNGTYTLDDVLFSNATDRSFVVQNAAPNATIASLQQRTFLQGTPFDMNVTVTLNDPNWGGVDLRKVTELADMKAGRGAGFLSLPAGVTVRFWDGDNEITDAAATLGALYNTTQGYPINVQIAGDNTALATSFDLFFNVTDDNGVGFDLNILNVTISPLRQGFNLLVDDGGDGVELDCGGTDCAPFQVADNADDPLFVNFTGNTGGNALRFTLGDFAGSTTTIGASNATVTVYLDADRDGVLDAGESTAIFTGAVPHGGQIMVPLTEANELLGGAKFLVVFGLAIPGGIGAGELQSESIVLGVPTPAA